MNPVHGDGQGLMGFSGDGAVGHSAGFKPLHNGFHAFHLIDGNGLLLRIIEVDQAP